MNKLVAAPLLLCTLLALPGCLEAPPDSGLTEEELGQQQSEIVQGAIEPDYKYPWEVSLNGCHGVLIDPRWVLTAAHCVPQNGWSYKVYYKRTDPQTGTVHSGQSTVGYGGVFIHPAYQLGGGFDSPKNDVALIRLDQPFAIDQYIQTVGLPVTPPVVGHVGTIAGYSHTKTPPPGYDAIYRAAIPSTPPGNCAPPSGAFCTHSDAASLCPGDSGSGFVTVENGRAVVTGIASYANVGDCQTVQPTDYAGFTDVYAFRGWILQTMQTTDAALAGNTRLRWSGRSAFGTLGIGCTNPYGTMWGPMNVLGVQLGANCAAGDTQAVVCSLGQNSGSIFPLVINGFKMKTTYANGTSTTQSLPFSSTSATYYGVMPSGATREFTCSVGWSTVVNGGVPSGGVVAMP